jgi:hypothetical protein
MYEWKCMLSTREREYLLKKGPNWRKGLRLVNLGFYPF